VEWANFYKVVSWLSLDFDLSSSRAKFLGDPAGHSIPGAVELVIASGAAVNLPSGVFAGLRARYFGPRPLIEDNSVRSKATTLFNLEAGYNGSSLPSLGKGEQFPRVICILALLCSHYKISLY
jgi:hypothetical protein